MASLGRSGPPQEVRCATSSPTTNSTPTTVGAGWSDCSASRAFRSQQGRGRWRDIHALLRNRDVPTTCVRSWRSSMRTHRSTVPGQLGAVGEVVGLGRLSGRTVRCTGQQPATPRRPELQRRRRVRFRCGCATRSGFRWWWWWSMAAGYLPECRPRSEVAWCAVAPEIAARVRRSAPFRGCAGPERYGGAPHCDEPVVERDQGVRLAGRRGRGDGLRRPVGITQEEVGRRSGAPNAKRCVQLAAGHERIAAG